MEYSERDQVLGPHSIHCWYEASSLFALLRSGSSAQMPGQNAVSCRPTYDWPSKDAPEMNCAYGYSPLPVFLSNRMLSVIYIPRGLQPNTARSPAILQHRPPRLSARTNAEPSAHSSPKAEVVTSNMVYASIPNTDATLNHPLLAPHIYSAHGLRLFRTPATYT